MKQHAIMLKTGCNLNDFEKELTNIINASQISSKLKTLRLIIVDNVDYHHIVEIKKMRQVLTVARLGEVATA
jgi:hypothetical protein